MRMGFQTLAARARTNASQRPPSSGSVYRPARLFSSGFSLFFFALLAFLAVPPIGVHAAAPWIKVKPVGEKKALPKGKTLLKSPSPDGQYILLLRDEGEQGDFFWRSVYVQHDGQYTLLQTCNQLRRQKWSSAPTTVTYEADVATGPTEMERSQVTYTPSTKTFRRRLIKKLKVEGAG